MATSILVDTALEEDGKQLLERLDRAGLPVSAAFWAFPSEGGEGSLVIASPAVDREGTLPVYRRINAALRQPPDLHVPWSAIVAVGTGDPVVRALGQPSAPRGEFGATINFADYSPYAPYLPEGQSSLRVHVYRLAPSGDAATLTASAPVPRDEQPKGAST